jgi:outer membrane protein TolC
VDRERAFGDLTLSWNIVDFGVSYLQAKQQADRVQIAKEQRRRVVNNLFQQVRTAYWTAAAAERLRPRLRSIIAEARAALSASRALEAERSQSPLDALKYQRTLLELNLELEAVDDKLSIAKTQLAELMGLRPGTPYRLKTPSVLSYASPIRLSIDEMEQVALVNRPELREEGYNARITRNEGRRALLRLVPGVNLLASMNSDSNSYLLYNNWKEASVRVAFNLMRLWSAPTIVKLNEAQAEIAETRRLAMTAAVLAQVHIAAQQYAIARKNYNGTRSIADVSGRIARVSADTHEAQSVSNLDLIWEKANAALADLRRSRAYADLQNADASIYVTLGLDPLPEDFRTDSLDGLMAAIRQRGGEWHRGKIPVPDMGPGPNAKLVSGSAVASGTTR